MFFLGVVGFRVILGLGLFMSSCVFSNMFGGLNEGNL